MKKLILLTAIILASGCQALTIPTIVELDLPPPIDYPVLPAAELECLSPNAYSALVIRDKLKSQRIDSLEAIIRSTHND